MHVLLRPALEEARAVLRDLDADQIPNDLRRVAQYGGGSLPPPLARSLLAGLEQYEWLREKAFDRMGEVEEGRRDRRAAAALYLDRPEGWALRVAEIAAAEEERSAMDAGRSAAGRRESLEGDVEALRSKLRDQKRSAAEAVGRLERKLDAATAELRRARSAEARDDRAVLEAVEAAEQAADRYRQERDAARRAAAGAQEDLREQKRLRRMAERAAAEGEETGAWVGEDSEALAVRLDTMARMARAPAVSGPGAGGPTAAPRHGLPSGVPPDSAAAIEWLLRIERPVSVVVDGYNAGFALAGDRNPGSARARLAPVLDRLATLACGPLRVTVVYDSALGPAEAPTVHGPVAARFSEAGRTADEEIVEMVHDLPGPVVVVTGDREVRDAVEASGAVPLWSRALIDWATRR
jgi:hypothetical protein